MGNYIVIDGGTTTTRIGLAADGKIIDSVRLSLGARANMENPAMLENAVRDGISGLLEKHPSVNAECVIAAGMITSEHGLYNLPHIAAPAGIDELHSAIKKVSLPKISSLPFYFVPGVKMVGSLEKTDMMRGEECEVFGILTGDGTYVLPGSHSKIIDVRGGKIADFRTLLTGEMAASLANGTILKSAVSFDAALTDEKLIEGYNYAKNYGLNEALFKVRILKNLLGVDENGCYSFFLGAVLEGEIKAILKSGNERIIIAGKPQLRDATAAILKAEGVCVEVSDDETVANSTFLGMIRIFEK